MDYPLFYYNSFQFFDFFFFFGAKQNKIYVYIWGLIKIVLQKNIDSQTTGRSHLWSFLSFNTRFLTPLFKQNDMAFVMLLKSFMIVFGLIINWKLNSNTLKFSKKS